MIFIVLDKKRMVAARAGKTASTRVGLARVDVAPAQTGVSWRPGKARTVLNLGALDSE